MLPQWVLNLGPQRFRINALLSELSFKSCATWDILQLSFSSCITSILDCDWRLKWCRKLKDNLRISQVAHDLIAQRGEHQIQMAEVPGSMLTGVTFCFHVAKPISAILWKTSIADSNGGARDVHRHSVQFVSFSCSFVEFIFSNNRLGLALPRQGKWIHQWKQHMKEEM